MAKIGIVFQSNVFQDNTFQDNTWGDNHDGKFIIMYLNAIFGAVRQIAGHNYEN